MKLTAEQLREKGFVEMPSGNWIKSQDGEHCLVPPSCVDPPLKPPKQIRQSSKPLLNRTEERWLTILEQERGIEGILKQSITLRLDPPYKSYRPDLSYIRAGTSQLTFVEVKGPHRFRRAGIAKAALAAKTYPQFRFELAEWDGKEWKETTL